MVMFVVTTGTKKEVRKFLFHEIVLFTDGDINLEVELSPELKIVWLTQKQIYHYMVSQRLAKKNNNQ